MVVLAASPSPFLYRSSSTAPSASPSFNTSSRLPNHFSPRRRRRWRCPIAVDSHLCTHEAPKKLDKSTLNVAEAVSDDELWAASCLRIRSFYDFQQSFGIEDHKRYLAEREFEALKERIAGKRTGFRRVSCINVTIPLSNILSFSDDLCNLCKFSINGEDQVVIGTLDLNQCLRLPDEVTGMKPQGIGADFARAYLSNVCVAKELHRNGLGYALIAQSKMVAEDWVLVMGCREFGTSMLLDLYDKGTGITDLYVHVAVDNEPAKKLYMKSGFVYESEEPAWQARFLDRPRRILLWTAVPNTLDL